MKRLNFGSTTGERFMCSKAEVNRLVLSGESNYEVIGVTPKGIIVEFKKDAV